MILLSATQITTADDCLRKWAFGKIGGLEDPGTESTELGKDCHLGWESWLKHGLAPGYSSVIIAEARAKLTDLASVKLLAQGVCAYEERVAGIVTSGIAKLPPPGPENEVEGEFQFTDHEVGYRGFKDLAYWIGDKRVLHDHKTTSALKWAKTQEQLRENVQLNLYAQSEFQRWDISEIECHWHYTTTTGTPTTRPVHLTVYRDVVNAKAEEIAQKGKRLLALYQERPDPNDLPPAADPATCERYRGCPYKPVCNRSPEHRVKGAFRFVKIKENPKMDFFAKLKQVEKPTAAAPAPAPEPAPAPAPAPATTLRAKLQAPPPSPGATGVVPPPAAAAQPAPAPGPEQPAQEPPKAGPGRPRKQKPAPEQQTMTVTVTGKDLERLVAPGFRLHINSIPQNTPLTPLGTILAPLMAQVAEQLRIPHYRLADYGKGKDALVFALEELCKQEPPTGDVFVDLRTDEGALCAATLARYAAEVHQGI